MAIGTTTTQVSVVNPEFIARARAAALGVSVMMPGGVGRGYPIAEVRDLRGRGTTVASFPIEDSRTAYDKTEGVNWASVEAFTPTDTTATVTEKIALEAVTTMADMTGQEPASARAARQLGVALGVKIDSDIFALNTSLDTDVGSASADCTFAYLTNGIQTLGAAYMDGPYVAVLHPIQWYDLINQGTTTISTAASVLVEEIRRNYYVKRVVDCDLIITGRIPTANSAASRSGAIFSQRPAYGLAELWWGMIREQEDVSLIGREIAASACYGVVEVEGTAAVALETGVS